MKHISKINDYEYWTTESREVDEKGQVGWDDIILVWVNNPTDDTFPREFVGWYYGEYDWETTERSIEMYWRKINNHTEDINMNIKDALQNDIYETLGEHMAQRGIESGDTSPAQELKMAELIGEISKLMEEIMEQNKPQPVTVDLPMTYVLLIHDALQTIKKHNLNELMTDNDKDHLDEVLERFCEPLMRTDDFDNVTIDFYE